jgi:membrane protease YdiL (CAAX protease family)
MKLAPWLRSRPLTGYFALTYGVSWGGILIVLGARGFDPAALQPLETGLIFLLMLLGPSSSGLALTALMDGRVALRRLLASLLHWRAGVRWYAFALLATPVLLLSILWPLSFFIDPVFMPRFQWPMFAIGLVAGAFEEIGWTGFATRRMLATQRMLVAGFGLGLLWALWHLLVGFIYNFNALGTAWFLEFAVFWIAPLTAYRLLMTWVYVQTRSLPVAVAMHASYTGWLFVVFPVTTFNQGLLWQTVFAVGLWVAVALVIGRSPRAEPRAAVPRPLDMAQPLAAGTAR